VRPATRATPRAACSSANDARGEALPVDSRVRDDVRVVVAHGAVHLAQDLDRGDAVTRRLQAHHHVGDLLAHRGGAGGLAVGAAEHGHVGVGLGQVAQLHQQLVQRRQHHGVAPRAQLQGVAGVVDVFAGAGEVHELAGFLQFRTGFEPGFDPVFNGLDVVVGGLLDLLDGHAIGFREVLDQVQQVGACAGGETLELLKTCVAQGDEPGHFDLNTAVHIALLAHQRTQAGELAGVAAIQRGDGRDGGKTHSPIVV